MSTQPNTTDLDRNTIREVFMRNGFTIKEGHTDLKPYVYAAADELIQLARRSQPVAATQQAAREQQEPVAWACPLDERGNALSEPDVDWGKDCIWAAEFKPFPLYAAPVAQQSEAGECARCGGEAMIYVDDCQTPCPDCQDLSDYDIEVEAGAPTAAASVRDGMEKAAQALGERAAGHYRNGDYELQDECLQCAAMVRDMKPLAPTSGRESAAPAAPVREGDREQDAKDAGRYRFLRENMKFIQDDRVTWMDLRELIPTDHHNVHTDWQEHLWDASVDATVDAAMQKGAQDNG